MDALAHFHFTTLPFTREIKVEHLFSLPQFTEARDGLKRTVERKMSAALIAPAGTGKTAVVRAMARDLPDVRYRVHYVKVTGLSKRDLCREIAAACALEPVGSYPSLVRRVQEAVQDRVESDAMRTVLILDEAHEMRPEVLGMLRILTNFDFDSRLVLALVLVGQPPLAAMLQRPELEDLARRIAFYATLRLLSRDEVRAYVAHRCAVAGRAELPFDAAGMEALFEIGRGNFRATDGLALGAIEAAAAKNHTVVDATHVVEARRNLFPT